MARTTSRLAVNTCGDIVANMRSRLLAGVYTVAVAVAVAAVVLATGAAGCDQNAGASDGVRPVEVRLGYFANISHAQAVLGVSSGEFASAIAPARLTARVFNAGSALVESLFAGEVDIGYIGPGPALNAFEKSHGRGIRVIAGAAANGVAIVARRDSAVHSLADLRNKRIATPQIGNTQDISARHYLLSELGAPNADNVVPIPNAELTWLMKRGQIDAAWTPEPWASRLIVETGARLIGEEKNLWPEKEFALAVVVVTPEFLRNHRDIVRKMLAVHVDWTRRLIDQPGRVAPRLGAALRELTGKQLPPGVFEQAFARTKFTVEPQAQSLRVFAQWAYEIGFAKQPADLTGLVDTSLLHESP